MAPFVFYYVSSEARRRFYYVSSKHRQQAADSRFRPSFYDSSEAPF